MISDFGACFGFRASDFPRGGRSPVVSGKRLMRILDIITPGRYTEFLIFLSLLPSSNPSKLPNLPNFAIMGYLSG